jgi:hypothetical protein
MHYSGSYIPRWCRCSSYREITQQRRSRLGTGHESYYTKLINQIFLNIKIERSKDQTPFRPPPVLGAIPPEIWEIFLMNRTWAAKRTLMLTSKRVKEVVGEVRPPWSTRWSMSVSLNNSMAQLLKCCS